MKKCPYCAEEIQDEAIVCRYRGRDLPKPLPAAPHADQQGAVGVKKPSNSFLTGLGKIAAGVLAVGFFCVFMLFVSLLVSSGKKLTSTATAGLNSSVLTSTFAVAPTITLAYTDTPRLTATLTNTLTTTPSQTPTLTLEPGTQTALVINQTATQRSIYSTGTALAASIRLTDTSQAKSDSATQTAIIIARNATGTAVQARTRSTGTAQARSDSATQIAQYTKINPNELVTYPENHKFEMVVIRGRVFNVNSNQEFQIWLDGVSFEAVYVYMQEPYDDIFEDDYVTIYGIVGEEYCGTNSFGAETCQPLIGGEFYEKK